MASSSLAYSAVGGWPPTRSRNCVELRRKRAAERPLSKAMTLPCAQCGRKASRRGKQVVSEIRFEKHSTLVMKTNRRGDEVVVIRVGREAACCPRPPGSVGR